MLLTSILPSGTTVLSHFFGYASSYFSEDTLEPGFGYWVKVSSAGKLILNTGSAFLEPSYARVAKIPADNQAMNILSLLSSIGEVSRITFSDVHKRTATLYFFTDSRQIDPSQDELPPLAPPGSLDVRFKTNQLVESADHHESKVIPVIVQGMEYPLTMEWDVASSGPPAAMTFEAKTVAMNGRGRSQITDPDARISLILRPSQGVELPKAFALNQNFPNPFNPSTVIQYALPIASRVSLKIYDLLGQEVITMVDEIQDAGYKLATWDASSVSTGVYFYRLTAGNFTEVKKMMFVK